MNGEDDQTSDFILGLLFSSGVLIVRKNTGKQTNKQGLCACSFLSSVEMQNNAIIINEGDIACNFVLQGALL